MITITRDVHRSSRYLADVNAKLRKSLCECNTSQIIMRVQHFANHSQGKPCHQVFENVAVFEICYIRNFKSVVNYANYLVCYIGKPEQLYMIIE